MMNIIESLNWRYATKKFDTQKPIPEEIISKLVEAISLSPSSYGMQPYKIITVRNKDLIQKLAQASYGQINVATASHLIIFAVPTNINNDFVNSYIENISKIRQIDINSLMSFREMLENYIAGKSNDAILKWASEQCYIALGNLLTVCAVEKIDSCPMGGFQPEKFDEILNLNKKNLKSIVFATLGYRASDDKYATLNKVRKPINEILIEY